MLKINRFCYLILLCRFVPVLREMRHYGRNVNTNIILPPVAILEYLKFNSSCNKISRHNILVWMRLYRSRDFFVNEADDAYSRPKIFKGSFHFYWLVPGRLLYLININNAFLSCRGLTYPHISRFSLVNRQNRQIRCDWRRIGVKLLFFTQAQ